MSPNVLQNKKSIALAVEHAVGHTSGSSLVQRTRVGVSYPGRPDVPGVWVLGPDDKGRYKVNVSISVNRMPIPEAVEKLRPAIWRDLEARGLAEKVSSIDIYVEDLELAV